MTLIRELAPRGENGWLAASLPVLALATSSIEAVRQAAVASGIADRIINAPIDPERVAAAFGSEKLFRFKGEKASAFAPMSGFFAAHDGWVRTHANYRHHAERLARILNLTASDKESVAHAVSLRSAQELEEDAAQAGAILVRVRCEQEWQVSPMGQAASIGDLAEITSRDDAADLVLRGGELPLAGLRVLDMTRVLAGPVCTRTLALLGAKVLRIDPPDPAEIAWQHLDTGQGKRSALLDARADLGTAQYLLDTADVLVTGYRPGAIDALGLRTPPGLISARVNAWGDHGPWSLRRGFDSIVQAASGIALVESPDATTPGALPAQALDHASGYLLASGIITALVHRADDGRGRDVRVSLARTAHELLTAPGRAPDHPAPSSPTQRATVSHGTITTARPALPGFDDYPFPAHPWGSDAATWS